MIDYLCLCIQYRTHKTPQREQSDNTAHIPDPPSNSRRGQFSPRFLAPNSPNNRIPRHAHNSSQQNRRRSRHLKPHPARKARGGNNDQPRIAIEAAPAGEFRTHVSDFPEAVYGGVDQADGEGVDAAEERSDPAVLAQGFPDADDGCVEDEAREEDADVTD